MPRSVTTPEEKLLDAMLKCVNKGKKLRSPLDADMPETTVMVIRTSIESAMRFLFPHEREVIILYYGLYGDGPYSHQQISKIFVRSHKVGYEEDEERGDRWKAYLTEKDVKSTEKAAVQMLAHKFGE